MYKRRILVTIAVVALFCGKISCTQKEKPPEEPPYPVRTEVIEGVKVITNPDYPRDGREVYAFEEEVNIGVEEGDENYMLNYPHDIKISDDGFIYVMDWQDDHIQVYDEDGKYVRIAANKGRGPGEFETPAFFDFLANGNMVLMDGRHRRVSILDKEGTYLDGFRVEGFTSDLIVDAQDRLYFARVSTEEINVVGVAQEIEEKLSILSTDLKGQPLFEHGGFRGKKKRVTRSKSGSSSVMAFRYAPLTAWTVGRDGKLYAGYNESYQLSVYDPGGDLSFKFGRDFTPVRIMSRNGQSVLGNWPAFDPYIIFDDEGNLWLWHYTGKEEEEGRYEHDVFSPDGIYIRQVVVPHRIRRIKNGKAYCIVRNEEGFRFIKRFRFVQK
jgi:hypothetical protein